MPDPTMPKRIPEHVERELREVLNWRATPAPVDLYQAIRDALERGEEKAEAARDAPTGGRESGL